MNKNATDLTPNALDNFLRIDRKIMHLDACPCGKPEGYGCKKPDCLRFIPRAAATEELSEKAWIAAAEEGERAVAQALKRVARRLRRTDHPGALIHASAMGALVELGREIRERANPVVRDQAEQYALANLRGALRGASGPIDEHGSPWGRDDV